MIQPLCYTGMTDHERGHLAGRTMGLAGIDEWACTDGWLAGWLVGCSCGVCDVLYSPVTL